MYLLQINHRGAEVICNTKAHLDNYSAPEERGYVLQRRGLLRRKPFWVGDILKRVEADPIWD